MDTETLYNEALHKLNAFIATTAQELDENMQTSNDFWKGYTTGQLNGFLIAKAVLATTYNELLSKKE